MKRLLFALLLINFSCYTEKQYDVGQIKTEKGDLLIWLYDETPNHKASFIKLAISGYWDSLSFNRVINNFVAQGGCPDTPEGFADSPYLLKPEFNDSIKHVYGSFAAGRDDNPEMLSAGCQFYIVQNKTGLTRLDNKYTVYGYVFEGMDVIDSMVNVPTDSIDEPLTKIGIDVNVIKMSRRDIEAKGFKVPK
ncbi:MAG: peptidylprolyl isomerase [Cyclobacteriaceae bacterium]|nr:peptidylprolyl isomerase [Cyclobacteriaceae bacterium]